MEGTFSEWKAMRAAVLQGAVLAPLLYNVFVAEVHTVGGQE
jgi:hypothetical protein